MKNSFSPQIIEPPPVSPDCPPAPATGDSNASAAATNRRRRGKIARLPRSLRDELNLRLENGDPYEAIIGWLACQGHTGFKKQNLHLWKEGGYQDWRRENERLENQAMQREWISEQIAQTPPGELFTLIDHLFASQLMDTLFGLDLADIKQGLADNPKHFVALLNAFNRFKRQSRDNPDFQEFLRRQKENTWPTRVITPAAFHALEVSLGLVPRDVTGPSPTPVKPGQT